MFSDTCVIQGIYYLVIYINTVWNINSSITF